jgi:hypothetical protein
VAGSGCRYDFCVELTRARRNELFRALADNGLEPGSCGLTSNAGQARNGLRITHRPTGSWFAYEPGTSFRQWSGAWRAGTDPRFVWMTADKWPGLVEHVREWARLVREWEQTPDLWALASSPGMSAIGKSSDNVFFTAEEQAEIAGRIDEVKALVREAFELEPGELEGLDQKLDEIKEATKRVGRKDWLIMLYGAALGMVLNDAVPPNVAIHTAEMIIYGVAHIFGLGSPPPAIPG